MWVCVCGYFFHFVSCSVFLIDLVTPVLLPLPCIVNHACKMLNKNQKNLSLLLSFFIPHPLVIIMIIMIITICKD